MKRYMNMTLAVATLIFAAGTVSAQTVMKADIPFAFHVGKRLMQPGGYHVRLLSSPAGSQAFSIVNDETKQVSIALPPAQVAAPKQWKADAYPRLSFECADGNCQLSRVWTGQGDVYMMPSTPAKHGDVRTAEITLHVTRAD